MNQTEALTHAVRILAALSVLFSAIAMLRPGNVVRSLSALFLAAGAAGLVATLALPSLLPEQSMVLRPDGSTADPRVVSALLLGAAALVLLLPVLRAPGNPAPRSFGVWVAGAIVAVLVASVGFMTTVRSAPALTGLALGGFVAGAAIALAARMRGARVGTALAVLATGTALLVIGAMTSLHGARATQLELGEGQRLSALGLSVSLLPAQAPSDSVRRLGFLLDSGKRSDTLWTELRGRERAQAVSVAGARPLGGPVIVPLGLRERSSTPRLITWIRKGETVTAGNAQVLFKQYRFVMGDPIRLYADLEVRVDGKTIESSPGAVADSTGMMPFEVVAEGYGPITIARVDADRGRVGLLLPSVNKPHVTHTALFEMRSRPGLLLAWVGVCLGIVAFLFSLGRDRTAGEPKPGH